MFFPLTQKCDVISCLPRYEFGFGSEEFILTSYRVKGMILNNSQDYVWARVIMKCVSLKMTYFKTQTTRVLRD